MCFHRILLYQPAHAKRHPALQPWIDDGFLHLRSPFENLVDKRPLETALRDFSSWGLFHQHRDMAYLKTVRNDIPPVDPEIARIASEIRGKEPRRPKASDEGGLPLQLFLHLAQEFDQHAWEMKEELSRLNHQYEALQSAFRQDQDNDLPPSGLPRSGEEDLGSFMIDKRMAAWNRLFQKDPAGSGLLITDSRSAYDYLLEDLEEKYEVLNLNITFKQAKPDEAPEDRRPLADHFQRILNMVLTEPWNQALQDGVVHASREIDERNDHARKASKKPHDRSVSFRWHVVPHHLARILFNRCCGVKTGQEKNETSDVKNTLVGLIQDRLLPKASQHGT